MLFSTQRVVERADAVADPIVFTPAGPFLKSKTHLVPPDATVQKTTNSVNIIGSDGAILHTAPIVQGAKRPILPDNFVAENLSRRDTINGWVASAYWGNVDSSPIKSFTTSWTVPPLPQNVDGQVIFIFNAIEPNSFDGILQPVLQFGGGSAAGGGNYWALASWYVGAEVYYTPLTIVYPGQTVTGVMTLQNTQTSGGVTTYNYNSNFIQRSRNASLCMSLAEQLTIAFEALEVYGVSGPTNLPHGSLAMRNINIFEQNGKRPVFNWETYSVADEGFGVNVVRDGGTNGEIDILYPLRS